MFRIALRVPCVSRMSKAGLRVQPMTNLQARRSFLRYLAASPLVAGGISPLTESLSAAADERRFATSEAGELISSVDEAINVFDFHAAARKTLPPAHYGYVATGTDDDATLRANREGFQRFQLRVRRLIDVRDIDTSIKLYGTGWNSPIALAPTGHQKVFHPLGEIGPARAAKQTSSLLILSTVSNTSVEEVIRERGGPVWFQLYANKDWTITRALLKRAEQAGCPVVALTVDMQGGSNRETLKRFARTDKRDCTLCHDRANPLAGYRKKPMFNGLDLSQSGAPTGMTWDFIRRLKDATSMKVFIKGIVTGEDTELCLEHGVDGVIVSNHGGRAEASGRATIACLAEVVQAAKGRIPVMIDGGVRRGTDVFKALALGADAVCIGRPYLWGLAAFGQEGVQAVLELLRAELMMVMRQAGTTSIDKISSDHIIHAG